MKCPRTECNEGYEKVRDPLAGNSVVLCWLCKGASQVTEEQIKSYTFKRENRRAKR
jgi:hypothetical protein